MANWKLHLPTEDNLFDRYKCGLTAGDRVRLKKDLVISGSDGVSTGEIHPAGEEWVVLSGVKSDPVLWLRRPDGERCTCDDDAKWIDEWFERV